MQLDQFTGKNKSDNFNISYNPIHKIFPVFF